MDNIDQQILEILNKNSKLTNKEIGATVHLTGQAVGSRILNLQDKGIIKRFCIEINYPQTQFVRLFMDSNQYAKIETEINRYPEVTGLYKVTGQACYMVIGHFSESALAMFIETISKWARYSVETVVADKINKMV